MTYTSYLYFFVFVGIVFLIYLMVPLKRRWLVLLGASYVFYGFLNGIMTLFLMAATVSTFVFGKQITKQQQLFQAKKKELSKEEKKTFKAEITQRKKLFVAFAVVINLGILVYLKYYNFFAGQIGSIFSLCGVSVHVPLLRLALPLGISYYTLQSIGYIIDVYRGKYAAETNLAKLALFLSFFPQMTEGPIGRYNELTPQLIEGHRYSNENFTGGVTLMLWGFFKKLVISDRASFIVGSVFDNYQIHTGPVIIIAVVMYTIQLYTDFSGCIDIMTGCAKMFGIELAPNFRQPFFSKSVAEFWRRWHITLGTWFKDYVFYPVSLSAPFLKLSKSAQKHFGKFLAGFIPSAAALFVVWMCTGIWHGAAWKYVVYGLYYFLIILLGMLVEPLAVRICEKTGFNRKGKLWSCVCIVRTFILVNIGMMLFRADYVGDFFRMLAIPFRNWNFEEIMNSGVFYLGTDKHDFLVIAIGVIIMWIVALLKEKGHNVLSRITTGKLPLKWAVMIGLIVSCVVFGAYGIDYGVVDNIYAQF